MEARVRARAETRLGWGVGLWLERQRNAYVEGFLLVEAREGRGPLVITPRAGNAESRWLSPPGRGKAERREAGRPNPWLDPGPGG